MAKKKSKSDTSRFVGKVGELQIIRKKKPKKKDK